MSSTPHEPGSWSTLSDALKTLRQNGVLHIVERSGTFASPGTYDHDIQEIRDVLDAWVDFLHLHALNMVFFAYDELGLDDQAKHGVLHTHRLSLEFTAVKPGAKEGNKDAGVSPAKRFVVSRIKVVPLEQARLLAPGLDAMNEYAFEAEIAAGRALADAHFRATRHADKPERYIGCVAVFATVFADAGPVPLIMRTKLLYLDISGVVANGAFSFPPPEAGSHFWNVLEHGLMMNREDRMYFGTALRRAEQQSDDPWEIYKLDKEGYWRAYGGKPSEKKDTISGLLDIVVLLLVVWLAGRTVWRYVARRRARKVA